MQIRIRTALLLTLLLPLAACEPEADARKLISQGNTRIERGDPEGALASFDRALKTLAPGEAELRKDAALGKCEALAHVDGKRSETEFLRLANREDLALADYSRIVAALVEADRLGEALTLLEFGQAQLPQEARFAGLVQKVGRDIENASRAAALANDPEAKAALKRLEGLGYVGNDDRNR